MGSRKPPVFFVNRIRYVKDHQGHFVKASFGLTATQGRQTGTTLPVVSLVLTRECEADLRKRLQARVADHD